ncbi:Aquaporin [Fasciola hepatica]|uniref:Aquaporin n=1 Tax=Fasciola hepatica TaxID=6192 RepID=A0A4E0RZ52_FASHE|nr:Aquaporin [Fasciola hepatica]
MENQHIEHPLVDPESNKMKSEFQRRNSRRNSYTRMEKFIDRIRLTRYPLARACLAECCGTAIMVIFGCGVLAQVELGSDGVQKHGTFISVSLGWGFAVCLGVFFSGINGSGNINPAITLAWAVLGKVPYKRVALYTISQIVGGFLGAVAVFGVYCEKIWDFAAKYNDGVLMVNTTGNIFVTNPHASHLTCLIDQIMGTALLAACALAIVDKKTWDVPEFLHPLSLGLMVYALVGCFALNAGCALNPARDLGPRLALLVCGWGGSAFTSGNYYFWVPIIGPYVGAVIGALLYELTIGIHVTGRRTATEEGEALE